MEDLFYSTSINLFPDTSLCPGHYMVVIQALDNEIERKWVVLKIEDLMWREVGKNFRALGSVMTL